MRNSILWTILIVALLFGAGTLIYYNVQDYNSSIILKEELSINELYIGFSFEDQFKALIPALQVGNTTTIPTPKRIQDISVTLGELTYENKGSLTRSFELPRLLACVDTTQIPNQANNPGIRYPLSAWISYSSEPVRSATQNNNNNNLFEVFTQYNSDATIEVKAGQTSTYYPSIKNVYLDIVGEDSSALKNTIIRVYELPNKAPNPLDTFAGGMYGYSDCQTVATIEPMKTIKVV